MGKLLCSAKRLTFCCVMPVILSAFLLFTGCGGNDPKKALIGQWVMVETSASADLVGEDMEDMMEFFDDGHGLSEAHNVKRIGSLTKMFTWRISSDGRLIMVLNSDVYIYSIAELSKSTLILEGDFPNIGKVRTKYLTRNTKFELKIDVNPQGSGTVSPSGKVKHNVGTKVEVTATAAEGYAFAYWSGASIDMDTSVTVKMNSNQTLTANFQTAFTDSRDNKRYRMVTAGNLTWMAQNLNFETPNSWCYRNNSANCAKYGRLYTWDAAMKACPAGWRLPANDDWDDLARAAGGQRLQFEDSDSYYWNIAGKKLKSKTGWDDWQCSQETKESINKIGEDCEVGKKSIGNGTDEFGFSALPGGFRYTDGSFYRVGANGRWWSATEGERGNAWHQLIRSDRDYVSEISDIKGVGFSVLCVR